MLTLSVGEVGEQS